MLVPKGARHRFGCKPDHWRRGKGSKDPVTIHPEAAREALLGHLKKVGRLHDKDSARGYGKVDLPYGLERNYRNLKRAAMVICLSAEEVVGKPKDC